MIRILYVGNKLTKHGFSPGVIDTLGSLLEAEGYLVIYAGTKKNKYFRFLEIIWKLIINSANVDYILIDTYSTSAFWFAYSAGKVAQLVRAKYIPILHGGDLPRRLKRSEIACKSLFGNAYCNVAVSRYLQKEFEKAGYEAILIPNSLEINNYPFKRRAELKPNLLWVRAFHHIYNSNMAAEVLLELKSSFPNASLCMVGPDKDGSLDDFLKYIEAIGIKNSVLITGKLSKQEWINLSREYDFFINTTNFDNTPVSVIEAMALGLLVVSTNPGGIPYLLEDGSDALLVNPGDSQLMAEKIGYLINNSEVARGLAVKAREKVENFGWSKVRQEWLSILK